MTTCELKTFLINALVRHKTALCRSVHGKNVIKTQKKFSEMIFYGPAIESTVIPETSQSGAALHQSLFPAPHARHSLYVFVHRVYPVCSKGLHSH